MGHCVLGVSARRAEARRLVPIPEVVGLDCSLRAWLRPASFRCKPATRRSLTGIPAASTLLLRARRVPRPVLDQLVPRVALIRHAYVGAEQPMLLVTRKDLPADNLQEFIAYAKANQQQLQYGSGGVGSATHLGCILLNSAIGVAATHVPYRAAAMALQDLVAGRIDYVCPIASVAIAHIEAGQIKPIAILSKNRAPILPHLASAAEQGLAGADGHDRGRARRARSPLAGISARLRRQRGREMGSSNQGKRGLARLISSTINPRIRYLLYWEF